MIPIKPLADDLCMCPRCRGNLVSCTVVINGMRNLLDGRCEKCKTRYYVDLPSGHALFSPVAIDQKSGTVFDPANAQWLSNALAWSMRTKSYVDVPIRFYRKFRHSEIVLLNCLDYLYGHCLLKLLNAQYYVDQRPEVACCVLVPKQLTHLVPDGVAEIWEVDLPLKSFRHWYVSLEQQIAEEIASRDTCYLSVAHSHPHPSRYDLCRFVKIPTGLERSSDEPARIAFIYREDRLWGATLAQQARNIRMLYKRLKLAFPDIRFIVIGFGKQVSLVDGMVDERATEFSLEQEQRWLELYAVSDCVVGVHGSNMLLPSGLAKNVVELLPEDRFGNLSQDLLWPHSDVTGNEVLHRVRVLPGRPKLTDIKPALVASVVVHQLGSQRIARTLATSSLLPIDPTTGLLDTTGLSKRALEESRHYRQVLEAYDNRVPQSSLTWLHRRLEGAWALFLVKAISLARELLNQHAGWVPGRRGLQHIITTPQTKQKNITREANV